MFSRLHLISITKVEFPRKRDVAESLRNRSKLKTEPKFNRVFLRVSQKIKTVNIKHKRVNKIR